MLHNFKRKLIKFLPMSLQDRKKIMHDLIERQSIDQQEKTQLHNQIRETNDQAYEDLEVSLKEKFGEPRQQAEAITSGAPEKHLGEHTKETLDQEVYSLGNTKPAFRGKKWQEQHDQIAKELNEKFKINPRQYQGLINKLHAIDQGEM